MNSGPVYGRALPRKPDENIPHGKRCWLYEGHHACAARRIRKLSRNGIAAAFSKRGSMLAQMAEKLTRVEKENRRLTEVNANLAKLARHRRSA